MDFAVATGSNDLDSERRLAEKTIGIKIGRSEPTGNLKLEDALGEEIQPESD